MKTHLLITGFLLLPILFFGQVLVNDHFEDDALGALPAGYVIHTMEQEPQIKKW